MNKAYQDVIVLEEHHMSLFYLLLYVLCDMLVSYGPLSLINHQSVKETISRDEGRQTSSMRTTQPTSKVRETQQQNDEETVTVNAVKSQSITAGKLNF